MRVHRSGSAETSSHTSARGATGRSLSDPSVVRSAHADSAVQVSDVVRRGDIESTVKPQPGIDVQWCRAVAIVDELRGSLNLAAGGEIAANLADLYDYVARQLTRANAENRTEMLDEVSNLLREVRGAWIQIAPKQA